MKPLPFLLLVLVASLSGCAKGKSTKPYVAYHPKSPAAYGAFNRYPEKGPSLSRTITVNATEITPGGKTAMPSNTSILDAPETKTPSPDASKAEYGVVIVERPGYLRSPYSPSAAPVDVRGFSPGSEVRDPENGKVFLVPIK